eukprot:CAMPEP_0170568118 /NCGR_PEP_ID=MMETSP0211-20121228/80938_1 /TAXON_ID=311385 /ORGANISM="Pseudokeronopsis sp., Strain OXSARD2" /LENGTH=33 /DNA_ID= /DNA_START= /DNA_END= /DNA_ORIENTATION=
MNFLLKIAMVEENTVQLIPVMTKSKEEKSFWKI